MSRIHKSVMLDEVIEYLNIKSEAKIIDATINGGGHAEGILERYPDVKILGIEWDPDIVENLKFKIKNEKLEKLERGLIIVNDSYTNLKKIAEEHNFQPDGIIFDLGVSSFHYEHSGRGFSFLRDELLDMRFNPNAQTTTAGDIINTLTREELEDIFLKYGEEKFAHEISTQIIRERNKKPIIKTSELSSIIISSVPTWYCKRRIHPATKTFQALRIAVNNELDNVEKGVLAAIGLLNGGGRLVVISFHGLEDKIVREIFKQKAKEGVINWVTRDTIKPKWEEIKRNPRARSANMKIIEKV